MHTHSRPSRSLMLLALTTVVALVASMGVTQAQASVDDFRVKPYLQNPSPHAMTVTWFSRSGKVGTLALRGPGLHATYRSQPALQPLLDYTALERQQQLAGLEQGSWLQSGRSVKHVIQLSGLRPSTTYRYTVSQNGGTFSSTLTTAPTAKKWDNIRFAAMSDSETEPLGRTLRREWAPGLGAESRPAADATSTWGQAFGTTTLSGAQVLRYALTEDEGLRRNLEIAYGRNPDFLLHPGDLVQGGGYQPGWDEFFRYHAGEVGTGLSHTPLLPAFGNWESFGALNNGYGTPQDRSSVVNSRAKYHTYFDAPSNGTPEHRDNYYRIDYGPVTVITLDSNNGEPDDRRLNYSDAEKATGREYRGDGTDTQENFTREEYEAAGGTDLSDFNKGSTQWNWAEQNLADARRRGQIVFVQFHHNAFSSGEHGLPMYHKDSSGQGGIPMRQYHPLFEKYGVSAVISGHSELFERSFVDSDRNGVGVHYYDVGVAGDGLRGERRDGPTMADPVLRYNPYRQWTADQDAREVWQDVDGTRQLVSGGKHYGHLEVNVDRLKGRAAKSAYARVTLTPVYSFPVLDASYQLVRTERRIYDDKITLLLDRRGRVIG